MLKKICISVIAFTFVLISGLLGHYLSLRTFFPQKISTPASYMVHLQKGADLMADELVQKTKGAVHLLEDGYRMVFLEIIQQSEQSTNKIASDLTDAGQYIRSWMPDFQSGPTFFTRNTESVTEYGLSGPTTQSTDITVSRQQQAGREMDLSNLPPVRTLAQSIAKEMAIIKSAAGKDDRSLTEDTPDSRRFPYDAQTLETDAILTPQKVVVISSSHDGQIKDLPFRNGDIFQKGDILVAYHCENLHARAKIIAQQTTLAQLKLNNTRQLFELDLISELEREKTKTELTILNQEARIVNSQLEDCVIQAPFDGRVTNMLANSHEYTRTDRVLMEVASIEDLNAEMLISARWLRWLNIGAPLEISLADTQESYQARILRIGGEVDPVNQTVPVVAQLKPYQDRLLPGMSGVALFDMQGLEQAGISGYLEQKRSALNKNHFR